MDVRITHHASLTYLRATTHVLGRSEVGLRGCEGHEFTAGRRTVETDGVQFGTAVGIMTKSSHFSWYGLLGWKLEVGRWKNRLVSEGTRDLRAMAASPR